MRPFAITPGVLTRRRPRIRTVASLAALALAVGCGHPARDYHLPPQPLPEHEKALTGKTATIGEVSYTAIGLGTKIPEVIGSHGSWIAHGQFVRVRLLMVDHGRERHDFNPYRQLLVTTDGAAHAPSYDAMQISRAPNGIQSIASQEMRAFDLWFDVPANARVRALRVLGDPSSSRLADQLKGAPVAGAKNPVDIPLT
ncbi:DUF4352 domain-containing protein [Actinoallomurus purpureus]|uniref:DUF4352 domain-containing protein n=1 Tax=Actinoallomurus purpureus TaxID=478114 RepID=UPI002093C4B5|nr:DUF4352 domain-containing protein [Actinoallomurus purpureus]MCO6011617.1 DUF4352 domain-containing protein [Actinoallomurus purpureus]